MVMPSSENSSKPLLVTWSADEGSPLEMMSHSPFMSEVRRVLPSAMILNTRFLTFGASPQYSSLATRVTEAPFVQSTNL